MKCDICRKEIGTLFLGKIIGTYIKVDGKQKTICSECQGNFPTKEKIISALKK